jgi:L-rhamnose isomerase
LADTGLDVEAMAALREGGYEQKVAAERGMARGVGGGLPAT